MLHPYLGWEGPMAFAHRGGTGSAPENTMAAFANAVDLGYTYLETDVHVTSDGVLVAFHDPDLRRTCGVDGVISEMTIAQIREVRIDGEHPIPLFDELIEAFPRARWNIDCKADDTVDALASAIRRHNLLDRCCLGAFSDRRLHRLRTELGDGLCTSFGPLQTAWWRFTGRTTDGADCAQIPTAQYGIELVTSATVKRSHQRGVPVIVWTIDDPVEMHRLLDLGVDGIMTDRPDVLKQVLLDRDAWTEA